MAYKITVEDFLTIVENPDCAGTETTNGKAQEGHQHCGHCKGNYFVGGECNYGGRHKMSDDLRIINKNLEDFNDLVKKNNKITDAKNEEQFNKKKQKLMERFQQLKEKCEKEGGKDFFLGSCIGLDGSQSDFTDRIKRNFRLLAQSLERYKKNIEKSTWESLKSFKEIQQRIENLNAEKVELQADYKDAQERGDHAEAARLLSLIQAKDKEIATATVELKKHQGFNIFSLERGEELANIVKNIFHGQGNFFNFTDYEESDDSKLGTDKYFGFIPKKWGKILLGGAIIAVILLVIYFIYRQIKKNF